MISKRYTLLILALLLSISACSSKPERNGATEQVFTTDIRNNGSKRFLVAIVYAQDATGRQSKPERSGRGGEGGGRGGEGGGRGGQDKQGGNRQKGQGREQSNDASNTSIQRSQGGNSDDDRRAAIISLLEEKLTTTAYCRNGFIELDYSQMPDRTELKGECQESASQQDKERWG